jgi:hypothetical protein
MRKFLPIVFTLILSYSSSNCNVEKIVINNTKEVSQLELRDIKSAWEIIGIDYPKAKPVFIYSCNNVHFCLFDLQKDNKFVIFNSPEPQVVKLVIDGVNQPNAIQKCYMKLPPDEAINGDSVAPFGGIFELKEGVICDLHVDANTNSGEYKFILSKKIDGARKKLMPEDADVWSWWEGNVKATRIPIE